MVWGAIAGAAISAAGSFLGGRAQNKAAQAASREQMAFQRETLQHQYRWAMADMRAAGLNPMLAYQQGGAGSAGGSSYSPVNVGAGVSDAVGKGVTSALSEARLDNETKALETNVKNTQQQTKNLKVTNKVNQQDVYKRTAETLKTREERLNQIKMGKILDEEIHSAKRAATQAKSDEALMRENPTLRKLGTILRELGFSGNSALNSVGNVSKSLTKSQRR